MKAPQDRQHTPLATCCKEYKLCNSYNIQPAIALFGFLFSLIIAGEFQCRLTCVDNFLKMFIVLPFAPDLSSVVLFGVSMVSFRFIHPYRVSVMRCTSRCGSNVHFLRLPIFPRYFCVPRVIFVVFSLVVRVFSASFMAILLCFRVVPSLSFLR